MIDVELDGWYMCAFKYTGKPTSFTIKVTGYPDQTVTLKANGFLVVNFDTPGIVITTSGSDNMSSETTDSESRPPKKK